MRLSSHIAKPRQDGVNTPCTRPSSSRAPDHRRKLPSGAVASAALAVVPSKQKPPWISAVTRLLVSWAPCWSYGQIDVRKNTGRGGPNFSVRWFCSTAPGFRNWHLPVHMGILAHPRPCHRLAVPAAPHEPCTRELVYYSRETRELRKVYIRKIDLDS